MAEARGGYGENVFEEWMHKGLHPENIMRRIKANFIIGAHKAYGFAKLASRTRVSIVKSLGATGTQSLFADKADGVQAAFDAALHEQPNGLMAILAQGPLLCHCSPDFQAGYPR